MLGLVFFGFDLLWAELWFVAILVLLLAVLQFLCWWVCCLNSFCYFFWFVDFGVVVLCGCSCVLALVACVTLRVLLLDVLGL